MKSYFIFLILLSCATKTSCQNNNGLITDNKKWAISLIDGALLYPLESDIMIKEFKKANGGYCNVLYPLLIVNNIIIREEEKVNYFRKKYPLLVDTDQIIKIKYLTKKEAEKMKIPNVPIDGVVLVYFKTKTFIEL